MGRQYFYMQFMAFEVFAIQVCLYGPVATDMYFLCLVMIIKGKAKVFTFFNDR